jgi:predicted nucleotidyltransferase
MTNNTQTHAFEAAARATGLDVMLLAEYGSQAHGTATEASDHDLLGIYVEHDHQLYGLEKPETANFRVLADGNLQMLGVAANTPRSGADDVEMHFHPLRKYVSLAARGNPTVLSAMWAYDDLAVVRTRAGDMLASVREAFLSKHAGFRHAGYARAQRDALLGLTNKRTNRPELVALHSYDTKYGAHLIRLLYAGLDLVRDRTFHLPMKPEQLDLLREIRRGEVPLEDLLTLSEKLEHELTTETTDSNLPDSVDYEVMNTLLRDIRNHHLGR